MKSAKILLHRSILAVALVAISAGAASAYDHDKTGWIDDQHQHHPFTKYHGHRGYWDRNAHGIWLFVKV